MHSKFSMQIRLIDYKSIRIISEENIKQYTKTVIHVHQNNTYLGTKLFLSRIWKCLD